MRAPVSRVSGAIVVPVRADVVRRGQIEKDLIDGNEDFRGELFAAQMQRIGETAYNVLKSSQLFLAKSK